MKISFEEWEERVNKIIISELEIELADLPDCNYKDWYEDGLSPRQAASCAIQNAELS